MSVIPCRAFSIIAKPIPETRPIDAQNERPFLLWLAAIIKRGMSVIKRLNSSTKAIWIKMPEITDLKISWLNTENLCITAAAKRERIPARIDARNQGMVTADFFFRYQKKMTIAGNAAATIINRSTQIPFMFTVCV